MTEEAEMKRVVLIEDHSAFRLALAMVLEREPGVEVVAQAGTLEEGRACAEGGGFDVAVVDLMLPDGDGALAVRALREANPESRILVLSADSSLDRALEAGADEALGKNIGLGDVIAAIRRLASD